MRLSFAALSLSLVLVACIDMTGLFPESSREPKGNPSAIVTVEEFADLQCPACKSAHATINGALLAQYGDRIRFEFRHMPLTGIHPYALEAAQAAECAADQGNFWEFVDLTFANQSAMNADAIRAWGAELGLDADLFDRCIRSGIKKDTVLDDRDEGLARNVNGTPTYFVNGQIVPSNLESLGAAIEAAYGAAESVPL